MCQVCRRFRPQVVAIQSLRELEIQQLGPTKKSALVDKDEFARKIITRMENVHNLFRSGPALGSSVRAGIDGRALGSGVSRRLAPLLWEPGGGGPYWMDGHAAHAILRGGMACSHLMALCFGVSGRLALLLASWAIPACGRRQAQELRNGSIVW